MRASVLGIVTGVLAMSACLTDESTVALVPASLDKVASDDSLVAPAGARVPTPLRVTARAEDGTPVPRAEVSWEVVSGPGGAVLSDAVTVSDGLGNAQVELILGAEGTHTVRAALTLDTEKAVTFTALATPAPAVSSVSPATFSSGDVVVVRGVNFDQSTGFVFDGALALVQGVNANGLEAQVIVPACLTPGQVGVRAVFAGAFSDSVVGQYVATGTLALAVGEYTSMASDAVAGCATLPAAGATGAQYLVAPQSHGAENESTSYRLRGSLSSTAVAVRDERQSTPTAADAFHNSLRAMEREMAALPHPDLQLLLESQAPAPPVVVGSRRDFSVCEELPCGRVDQFTTVRAEARFVGEHAAIYQDVDAPSGGFTDSDFESFGATFDEELYDVDTQAFGAESDIDQNGLVVVLLTPAVNKLTDEEDCGVSFVSGFFFPVDIDPNFARDSRSNQAEVFYGLVPDPTGSVRCEFTVDRIRRLIPVTFVHEFQHMINYYQKVLLRDGNGSETLWLNEAMSHVAEELAARRFLDLGDSTLFNRFAIGNIVNANEYLEDPGAVFMLADEGTGSLAERGAAWLFLRWLVDRHGDGVTRRLSETSRLGTANVEAATGLPISVLLSRWFQANWVSDLPDFEAPPELQYTSWKFRTTYGSLNEQAPDVFPNPFPLEPEVFFGGMSFNRTGVLRAGSGDYYIVNQGPGDPGVSLEFLLSNGMEFPQSAMARLNVIRIK